MVKMKITNHCSLSPVLVFLCFNVICKTLCLSDKYFSAVFFFIPSQSVLGACLDDTVNNISNYYSVITNSQAQFGCVMTLNYYFIPKMI